MKRNIMWTEKTFGKVPSLLHITIQKQSVLHKIYKQVRKAFGK